MDNWKHTARTNLCSCQRNTDLDFTTLYSAEIFINNWLPQQVILKQFSGQQNWEVNFIWIEQIQKKPDRYQMPRFKHCHHYFPHDLWALHCLHKQIKCYSLGCPPFDDVRIKHLSHSEFKCKLRPTAQLCPPPVISLTCSSADTNMANLPESAWLKALPPTNRYCFGPFRINPCILQGWTYYHKHYIHISLGI